jgi:hypothetical protein
MFKFINIIARKFYTMKWRVYIDQYQLCGVLVGVPQLVPLGLGVDRHHGGLAALLAGGGLRLRRREGAAHLVTVS